ncbi:spoVK [Symbiodinium microadriaticum]|nr:spoVK [Symbiodinium microadriaticum]
MEPLSKVGAIQRACQRQLSAFRRQPDLLVLPTLSPTDVAMIAEVEKRGCEGAGSLEARREGDVGTKQLITVLEHIVRQRFDEKLIREKNGHLARDVLVSGIVGGKTILGELPGLSGFRLTPMDFGLDVLTAEQRERRMREVEAEAPDERPSFVWRRVSCERLVPIAEKKWSGQPGFERTPARSVSLQSSICISCQQPRWTPKNLPDPSEIISARLAAAEHGCLAIKDVDALVDSREVVRALAAALGNIDGGSSSTTLLIIIGTQQGLARIARMEPSLEARFPTNVAIPDFTAVELVQFIANTAAGGQGKELGERGNLALARRLLQRAVQNRITRLFNRIQSGQTPGENPESEFLTKEDFEVGAPIGEGKEQKDAIDEEVSNLVGMTKAKEWFAEVRQRVAFVEQTGTRSDLRVCLNIIITGHPGTGKTTFARLLARFFHTYGVLPKDSFVEQNGLELKAEFMGGTAPRVSCARSHGCPFFWTKRFDSAAGVGGAALRTLLTEVENHRTNLMAVLAGYKAYALADWGGDKFSGEVIRTLLTEVENHRTGLLVVLAGYADKMDAGSEHAAQDQDRFHLSFVPGLRDALATHIRKQHGNEISQHNGGLAVTLADRAFRRLATRLAEAVGSLAREMAAELLKGVESVELLHFIKQHQGTSDVICGDGNCQFSSFAFCYGGMDHQVAREEACRWLETNWSRTLVAISVIFGYVATLHFWRAHQATCLDQGQPEVLRLHH